MSAWQLYQWVTMISTRSVEDVDDAADCWHLFGTECPKEEIVFFCQAIVLYTVIVVSIDLQPGCRTRRLYPLDCFTEQLVRLSVTQHITETRRWRLSFTSFYPLIHRWSRTRTIRWHSTLYQPATSHKSLWWLGMRPRRDTLSARLVQRSKR